MRRTRLLDWLTKIRPLYLASGVLGVSAALVVISRQAPLPVSAEFRESIQAKGFQSEDEYARLAELINKPDLEIDRSDEEFLSLIIGRGNEASWMALFETGRFSNEDSIRRVLPGVRALAATDPSNAALGAVMDDWVKGNGLTFVESLLTGPSDPLSEAVRSATIKVNSNEPQ